MTALLVLSYVGFVSLGLPDGALGAAWPAMRSGFGLPLDAIGPAVLIATSGSVLSSALSGRLLARGGPGPLLAASATLAGLGLLGTALAPRFPFVLGAALLSGLGGGAVDAALNGFVARHFSARHMSFLHAFWGVGATLGPLALTAALAAGHPWRAAYGALAGAELLLALAFFGTLRAWNRVAQGPAPPEPSAPPEPAQEPRVTPVAAARRASVALFCVYGGLEASAGLWGASLLLARGASPAFASATMAAYWGALTSGRFLSGFVVARTSPELLLRGAVIGASIAVALLAMPGAPLALSVGALALLGVALAPIYPQAMHETPHRFGATAATRLVGHQVAASIVGIAALPWLLGRIARSTSIEVVPPALIALAVLLLALERLRRI